jgi:hypothetical protein
MRPQARLWCFKPSLDTQNVTLCRVFCVWWSLLPSPIHRIWKICLGGMFFVFSDSPTPPSLTHLGQL